MDIDSRDTDVFQLLKKLKEANGAYPQELLVSRREGYLKQVAEVSGGAGLALGLRNTLKSGKGAGLPPVVGTVLEGLLVVAIVVESSTVAYFYRDKIADFFQNSSNQPRVEEVTNPPIITSPIPDVELTLTAVPEVTETQTETATAVSTPSILAAQPTQQGASSTTSSSSSQSSNGTQANATSEPNGNNGNQYGHTPKPERTRQPGNNSENNPDSQGDSKRPH